MPPRRHSSGLILALALLVTACATAPGDAVARSAPESFSPLVKRVLPAVVNIAVTETISGGDVLAELPQELRDTPLGREFRRRFGNKHEQSMGAGSGFIIDASGLIVTNNHVVGHADKIVVSTTDGKQYPARVIGSDELTDVALIRVSAPGPLPDVAWGDSQKVEVGDWVLAAGNPFGLGGSVTAGIVSALGRDLGAGPFDNFLQLDAPINPGNSGGPIFNMDGQVVGISTAIVSPSGGSVGIGFATPSELVIPIIAQLRDGGHIERGWLGVSVEDSRQRRHRRRRGTQQPGGAGRHSPGRHDPGSEWRAPGQFAQPDPIGRSRRAGQGRQSVNPPARPRHRHISDSRPASPGGSWLMQPVEGVE